MTTQLDHNSKALRRAAWHGETEEVKLLLAVSDPLAMDFIGRTALMFASWSGHEETVALLLPVSDALARDNDGRDALVYAARSGKHEVASLIQAFLLSKEEGDQLANEIPEAKRNKKGARL